MDINGVCATLWGGIGETSFVAQIRPYDFLQRGSAVLFISHAPPMLRIYFSWDDGAVDVDTSAVSACVGIGGA
jgi:hypothetical protein